MRALLVDPSSETGFRLGETADPAPAPHQALVEVKTISLNYGEVSGGYGAEEGKVQGWDAAGVVVKAAADGSGPEVGSRVVTFAFGGGGWAQLRAVDVAELAVLPDNVDFAKAAALPVAAVTALRALRRFGSVLGRRVLVTGAAGGVGRFAVQLAALAGAHVIASVGSVARGEGLKELGARKSLWELRVWRVRCTACWTTSAGRTKSWRSGCLPTAVLSSPSEPLPASRRCIRRTRRSARSAGWRAS
jgi:NADPH:quinone reductase-like Zn-dependent oxidoreductase